MNDKEIIKALPQIKYGGCKGCAYGILSGDDRCGMKGCKIARDALDLIKRQQTDIIMLKQNRVTLPERIEIVDNARKQAVREFADRLKSKCRDSVELDDYRMTVVTKSDIDDLANEMFPEQKGE